MHAPAEIACAHCGKPLFGVSSYGLSVPVDEARIRPSDFCDLTCIAAWLKEVGWMATAQRQ